jgi:arylsulfatase A-like enzyme
MLPTFAKIVGVEPAKDSILDGRDITPLMFNANAGPVRDTHLYIGGNNAAAIRQGDWKLFLKGDAADKKAKKAAGKTKPPKGGPVPSLYNLATDPGETQDVAAANPEIVARLKQELLTRDAEIQANKRPVGKHTESAK